MRDTIIFSGQSNTFGLGLEWELDPELNDENFLKKGIQLPIHLKRYDRNQQYWRPNRWSKLVSDALGYREYNVHDKENHQKDKISLGGNGSESMWHLLAKHKQLTHILERTKYIVLEIGYVRWWDANYHGREDGDKLPSTPIEIENYINSKNPDDDVVREAIKWVQNYDLDLYMEESLKKLVKFRKIYPEIGIVLVPWSSYTSNIVLVDNEINDLFKKCVVNTKPYSGIYDMLEREKLMVCHKAKGFNGNYKYNYREDHASLEGQRRVAELVINHIKNKIKIF
jgi:hypothetical protein